MCAHVKFATICSPQCVAPYTFRSKLSHSCGNLLGVYLPTENMFLKWARPKFGPGPIWARPIWAWPIWAPPQICKMKLPLWGKLTYKALGPLPQVVSAPLPPAKLVSRGHGVRRRVCFEMFTGPFKGQSREMSENGKSWIWNQICFSQEIDMSISKLKSRLKNEQSHVKLENSVNTWI